jgi:hypothetical protein
MKIDFVSLPANAVRVEQNTSQASNDRIHERTLENIMLAASGGLDGLHRRLRELDREWDIERLLQTNASSITLAGIALGTFVDRRWFALPAAVAGFLLMHSLQGWCPPIPLLRRLGVRTMREIEVERLALRLLRGDFQTEVEDPREAMEIAENA